MRILYIHQYFGTPEGSWSTRAFELSRRWVEKGHHVTVVTSPYDKSDVRASGFVDKREIHGIRLIIIDSGDSNRLRLWKRAFNALIFAVTASFFSIKERADVVIASSGPITVGIPGLLAKWMARKTLVFEVRDLWPQGGIELGIIKGRLKTRLSYFLEALCYANSALVVAASIGMEQNINKRFPKVKTLVIPNASDNDLFGRIEGDRALPSPMTSKEDDRGTPVFIYAGSLGLMDAVDEILHGFYLLKDKVAFQCLIIGDGAERIELEKLTLSMGLSHRVKFLGLRPKYEIVDFYKRATASFVVFKDRPVLGTVSPNKMFDSFAAGVPIIQNTSGWISELVENENCGFNVRPRDPISMADAILNCYDKNEMQAKSQSCRKLARGVFDRDRLSDHYLENLLKLHKS